MNGERGSFEAKMEGVIGPERTLGIADWARLAAGTGADLDVVGGEEGLASEEAAAPVIW